MPARPQHPLRDPEAASLLVILLAIFVGVVAIKWTCETATLWAWELFFAQYPLAGAPAGRVLGWAIYGLFDPLLLGACIYAMQRTSWLHQFVRRRLLS